jgi:RNA-binding protein
MILNSKQRAYLRSLATAEPTIMQIGNDGDGQNLVKTVSDALEARELIKLSVLDNCAWTPREAAEALAEATDAAVVGTIGKKLILYRPSKKNPNIVLE